MVKDHKTEIANYKKAGPAIARARSRGYTGGCKFWDARGRPVRNMRFALGSPRTGVRCFGYHPSGHTRRGHPLDTHGGAQEPRSARDTAGLVLLAQAEAALVLHGKRAGLAIDVLACVGVAHHEPVLASASRQCRSRPSS
jgi:hypothetical protein